MHCLASTGILQTQDGDWHRLVDPVNSVKFTKGLGRFRAPSKTVSGIHFYDFAPGVTESDSELSTELEVLKT